MVHFLAFSLQDQVEKYGAYVGIAAFFGLAVLTLLYFSQARELRRLRDWAGRAPERAQELEARVTANAQAARSVQAVPKAATPAAAAAAAGSSGTVAPAKPIGAPTAAEAEAEAAAAGTATQVAEPAAGGSSDGKVPSAGEGEAPAKPEGEAGEEPKAEPAEGEEPKAEEAEAAKPAAEGETPAAAPAPQGGNGAERPDEEAPAKPEEEPAAATNGGPAGPAAVPPIPRATPVPRRTPAPAPAPAAPLRQPARSATLPPRRPTPAPRRGAAAPASNGGGRSWIVPAVLGVVLLGAVAFGATQILGGDDQAPSRTAGEPSPSPDAAGGSGTAEPGQPAGLTKDTVRIAVLNGTTITGLAGTEADKLRAAGFKREIITGNNTDQQRSDSSVLYAQGARAIGREVARSLDIAAMEQIDPDTRSLGENADVVVILGQDKAP